MCSMKPRVRSSADTAVLIAVLHVLQQVVPLSPRRNGSGSTSSRILRICAAMILTALCLNLRTTGWFKGGGSHAPSSPKVCRHGRCQHRRADRETHPTHLDTLYVL